MPRVIQFTCADPQITAGLRALMVEQVNTWSRLSRLAADPKQVTDPFDVSVWKDHLTKNGVSWANYDSIYDNLGDDGRKIADQMLGSGPMQGILLNAPLMPSIDPAMRLSIVQVTDMVSEGYQTIPTPPRVRV
jgi:hypothetical protein